MILSNELVFKRNKLNNINREKECEREYTIEALMDSIYLMIFDSAEEYKTIVYNIDRTPSKMLYTINLSAYTQEGVYGSFECEVKDVDNMFVVNCMLLSLYKEMDRILVSDRGE